MEDLLNKILAHCQKNKYPIEFGVPTILYLENCDIDGNPIQGQVDQWDDLRMLIKYEEDGTAELLGKWKATTQYGLTAMMKQKIVGGAAQIALGYHHQAWQFGFHKSDKNHPCLKQTGKITITRDFNQDGKRIGDKRMTGLFGINQHTTGAAAPRTVGPWSYGCLVGQYRSEHKEFLKLLASQSFLRLDPDYKFSTIIIDSAEL